MKVNYNSISILGSTGSIGTQTLEVIDEIARDIRINYLTANKSIDLLEEQAIKYNPKGVVVADEKSYSEFKKKTSFRGEILCGSEAVNYVADYSENDIVLSALVGFSGVVPAYSAVSAGKDIALANKESLVAAGAIISNKAKETGRSIIAVDSEHSAVLQCLAGERRDDLEKIILTASGGPFRNLPSEEFKNITLEQALNHPNWSMGNKITIDSATMMNKGFEIIEAMWLFDVKPSQIEVLIHPQSIVHSLVQFRDGSVKAQLGLPDMKLPIAYSLTVPRRLPMNIQRLDLAKIGELTFGKPDLNKFPCLQLAYNCLERGGNSCAVLNAANETAVYLFLDNKIHFTDIPKIIEIALQKIDYIAEPSLDDVIATNAITKDYTQRNYKEIIRTNIEL